jgi:hypothetical protein
METRNAVIVGTGIGIDDRGALSVRIVFDYGDSSQEISYSVYTIKNGASGENYAGYFMYQILAVIGVSAWEQLTGRAVRVMRDDGRVEAIGHIIADAWLNPGVALRLMD